MNVTFNLLDELEISEVLNMIASRYPQEKATSIVEVHHGINPLRFDMHTIQI